MCKEKEEEVKVKEAEAKMIMPGPFPPYFDRDREVAIQMLKMAIDLLVQPNIKSFELPPKS
jgi:hypothetical protein